MKLFREKDFAFHRARWCSGGGVEPSHSDFKITAQLKEAGEIVGIDLLDHIIFNSTGYFSFLENGKL